jgi:hypothetical protein
MQYDAYIFRAYAALLNGHCADKPDLSGKKEVTAPQSPHCTVTSFK